MRTRNPQQGRPEIIIGSLLFLMSAHRRTPCPCVAICVARHLECLTHHPEVDCVIRQMCDAVRKEWELAAGIAAPKNPPPCEKAGISTSCRSARIRPGSRLADPSQSKRSSEI